MKTNWKLIIKFVTPNEAAIGLVFMDGGKQEICRVLFPNDQMLHENCKACEEICKILKKRLSMSC